MKVGIITYHRAENYGSALQSYALSKTIEDLGHYSEIIDYHTKAQDKLYELYPPVNDVMGGVRNIHSWLFRRQLLSRKKKFECFRRSFLPLSIKTYDENTHMDDLNADYDYFICGSDQIWNTSCADFSTAYMLDFVNEKSKCISYAASIGKSYIDECDHVLFRDYLCDYKYLSVRESTGAKEIGKIINRNIDVVPDPVLLLDVPHWDKLITNNNLTYKYIFCYFIGDVPRMRDFAVKMRRLSNMPLILVNINLRDLKIRGKRFYDSGPEEFLTLLRNASYICTNSYHAVLFSLMYNKNFWVFANPNKGNANSRIRDILEQVSLSGRIINPQDELPLDPLVEADFSIAERYINERRKFGLNKLYENLR